MIGPTMSEVKQQQRERISADVDRFLAGGGTITRLEGVRVKSDYRPTWRQGSVKGYAERMGTGEGEA